MLPHEFDLLIFYFIKYENYAKKQNVGFRLDVYESMGFLFQKKKMVKPSNDNLIVDFVDIMIHMMTGKIRPKYDIVFFF